MHVDTVTELLLSYLNSNYSNYFSAVVVTKNTDGIGYRSLEFTYNAYLIEVRVYNSQFIKVSVDNEPGKVFDSYSSVRTEIDRLAQRLDIY